LKEKDGLILSPERFILIHAIFGIIPSKSFYINTAKNDKQKTTVYSIIIFNQFFVIPTGSAMAGNTK